MVFLRRETGFVLYALTWLGHPGFYNFSPPGIMGGLFMGLGSLLVAIDFVQDKPLRIIGLLEYVKTQIARLKDGS